MCDYLGHLWYLTDDGFTIEPCLDTSMMTQSIKWIFQNLFINVFEEVNLHVLLSDLWRYLSDEGA